MFIEKIEYNECNTHQSIIISVYSEKYQNKDILIFKMLKVNKIYKFLKVTS